MKVVILAGGLGTRLSEETGVRAKPMVEIGGKPILWHIMKIYSSFGYKDFVICLGYKGHTIKEYFVNYFIHERDIVVSLKDNNYKVLNEGQEDWTITLVDTGLESMTGHRVKRIEKYVGDQFMLTYGDGVSNINIKELVEYHNSHGGIGTMTSVQPEGRFGVLDISENGKVTKFTEKPKGDGRWINGGFFVFNKEVFKYLNDDSKLVFEGSPLESLTNDGQLFSYKHDGFWKCMDTLRDKNMLEEYWRSNPPWKNWNN